MAKRLLEGDEVFEGVPCWRITALVSDLDLSRDSKRKLIKSLSKFPKLLSGGLGKVELKEPIDIELEKGATPHNFSTMDSVGKSYIIFFFVLTHILIVLYM